MGGASRSERKRRQAAAEQRVDAAGLRTTPKRNLTPLIVVSVVVLLAVVIGGIVLVTRSSSSGGTAAPATFPTAVSGAVVSAGAGPVAIDVYEDYLCPNCERFEARYGTDIANAIAAGQVTVRFHQIAILDSRTEPPGYSTRAANAALCAASAGIFPAYHDKLFAEQPAEGSAGLTDQQLVAFGTQLGAGGDFATCMTSGRNAAAVAAETDKAASDPSLQTNGVFGTPTVAVKGQKVNLNDTGWLRDAIAG